MADGSRLLDCGRSRVISLPPEWYGSGWRSRPETDAQASASPRANVTELLDKFFECHRTSSGSLRIGHPRGRPEMFTETKPA